MGKYKEWYGYGGGAEVYLLIQHHLPVDHSQLTPSTGGQGLGCGFGENEWFKGLWFRVWSLGGGVL